MSKRAEQATALRNALWVSRCVGHAQTAPLRLEDVEGIAGFIQVRTLAAGEPLAALLGARRPSVNRVLRAFARDGMVEITYGKVQILDAVALARVSAER